MAKLASPAPAEIATLRATYGLTQAQVAVMLHTSLRAYQQWEYGERPMHGAFFELLQIKLKTIAKNA